MKSVLISIRPKWCEFIASGKKTVEIRKTRPKLKTPFKCYIYCTKWGKNLIRGDIATTIDYVAMYGGKVIGEFICNNILEIGRRGFNNNFGYCYESLNIFGNEDIESYITAVRKSCLSKNELHEYAKNNSFLYAWHISNLEVYDIPKELSEFNLKRPPQSWCYVEEVSHDNQ